MKHEETVKPMSFQCHVKMLAPKQFEVIHPIESVAANPFGLLRPTQTKRQAN
jgi:hypothetical protein